MFIKTPDHEAQNLSWTGVNLQLRQCRRVLVMEWVTGVKLTGLPPLEIQRLVAAGQEAFLTQLLEIGFFHGDPHPGNLLKVCPINAKLCQC